MKLSAIRRLNLTVNTLLVMGLVMVFLGVAVGVGFDSEALFGILFTLGWIAVGVCLLLGFVVDRVRCPNCGKPFNRPEYRNWFSRSFAKTQTHRSCVHCHFGRTTDNGADAGLEE